MPSRYIITIFVTCIALLTAFAVGSSLANSELRKTYAGVLSRNEYVINNALLSSDLTQELSAKNPSKRSWIENSLHYFDTLKEIEKLAQSTEKATQDQKELQKNLLQKKLDLATTFTFQNPTSEATPALQNTIITIQTILNNPSTTLEQLAQSNELVSENNNYFEKVLNDEIRREYLQDLTTMQTSLQEQLNLSTQNNNTGFNELTSLSIETEQRIKSFNQENTDGKEGLAWIKGAKTRIASVKQAIEAEKLRIAEEEKAREEERKRKEEEAALFATRNKTTFKHVVVDISDQTMYQIEGDSLIGSTPVVTGRQGRWDTPTGKYSLLNKQRNVILNSPFADSPYQYPVNFWLPFTTGGHGIHDAYTRSEYGGNIYTYNGSHGCINTPYSFIEQLYSWLDVGDTIEVVP